MLSSILNTKIQLPIDYVLKLSIEYIQLEWCVLVFEAMDSSKRYLDRYPVGTHLENTILISINMHALAILQCLSTFLLSRQISVINICDDVLQL